MPTKHMTASFVERAAPQAGKLTEYRDAKVPNLALRVTPAGAKAWTLRYRLTDGAQRRVSLGRYPAVSLSVARDKAIGVLGAIADGKDPAEEKKQARTQAVTARANTVSAIGERYFNAAEKGRHRAGGRPKRPRTLALERYYFDTQVAPAFGHRPIAGITRAEIQVFVDRMADEHAPSTARQCRVVLQRLFRFAQWHEITESDPCQFVQVPSYQSRERVLTDQEIKLIWDATTVPTPGDFHMSPSMAVAIRLALVTLQRRSEITGLHMREIDLNARMWVIPGERTKNRRTHLVPLSGLAVDLIELARSLSGDADGYLFPSPRDRKTHVKPDAMTLSFRRLTKARPIEDARPHDLRRTGATFMTSERIGVSRFVVSQVLNHVSDTGGSSPVTAVYDRNAYLPEKRDALDRWAAVLTDTVRD